MTRLPTHVVIPDTQVKPNVRTDHLSWIGQYIVDRFAGDPLVRLVHLGDHADMPSLSIYEGRGTKKREGLRYEEDIEAANAGFARLSAPLAEHNRRLARNKKEQWRPQRHITLGNHEDRITRHVNANPELEGKVGLGDLAYARMGWEVHQYQEVLLLDGVAYSHFFYNPSNGRPYTGMAETRLRQIGHSFTQGHQQGLQTAQRSFLGRRQRALIAGSCYLHNEEYRGPQAADEWRGILVCHEVENGNYDLMEVSLDYLCRRYEGVSLAEFLR